MTSPQVHVPQIGLLQLVNVVPVGGHVVTTDNNEKQPKLRLSRMKSTYEVHGPAVQKWERMVAPLTMIGCPRSHKALLSEI